ncbi:hypothetical protein DSECCO2_413300 [anaerobic digester metagenome]
MDRGAHPFQQVRRRLAGGSRPRVDGDGHAAARPRREVGEDAVEVLVDQSARVLLCPEPSPVCERELTRGEPPLEHDHLLIPHLGAVGLDHLDAVVLGRVVRGGDHRAGCEPVADDELEGGRRQDAAVDDGATGGDQASLHGMDQHRPRGTGVPPDRDRSRAHRAECLPDPEHELRSHQFPHDAPHAVRSKEFLLAGHFRPPIPAVPFAVVSNVANAADAEAGSRAISARSIVAFPG